jgi:hypothetical protein
MKTLPLTHSLVFVILVYTVKKLETVLPRVESAKKGGNEATEWRVYYPDFDEKGYNFAIEMMAGGRTLDHI